jgi:Ca2+/Na+ antiporter
MGITVLAAGTSIPDALGSIAVAKQGQVHSAHFREHSVNFSAQCISVAKQGQVHDQQIACCFVFSVG